jgi:Cu/Ag efflux pump CusA
VRQCLLNLLSNACKFTEHGTITLQVRRVIESGGDRITFRVTDTGIGMTPEQQSRLFQDFSQADASTTRKYGGTGLGLAISQRFCYMMDGDIMVESIPGQGSTFTLLLPAEVRKRPTIATVQRQQKADTVVQTALTHGSDGQQVVLVIDDDPASLDLIVRLEQQYRDTPEEIANILVATPGGQQTPLKEFADIQVTDGAAFIYRQNNSRYIGVQFSVEGRDLAGAVEDAIHQVADKVALPQGYRLDWGGEYTEYLASRVQLNVILPLTLFLIFLLLFALYSNFAFPFITVLGVLLSAPVGGLVALWITGTPFSVSSGIGFLALFGVSVQTAVVYISYVNELRRDGTALPEAIRHGAILRLRPIMMTALVAALGLLPAALATGVGTDSQRPFALVIVSGLFTRLLISVFLMPVLYQFAARPLDHLEV